MSYLSFNAPTHINNFRFWCQKVLPLVYDDSLSYYELLCKVVDYLNKIIDEANKIGTDVTELYKAFNQLKEYIDNYFKNLDVQEEINKKLDEMFNDGKLNELLNLFIPYVTPEMFGAVGDGVTDDTIALNDALNYALTNKTILIGTAKKIYTTSKKLTINNLININFNNATIKLISDDDSVIEINYYEDIDTRYKKPKFTISNLTIDANEHANYGIIVGENGGQLTLLNNIAINNFNVAGYNSNSGDVSIDGMIIKGKIINNELTGFIQNSKSDNIINNVTVVDCKRGFEIHGVNWLNGCHGWFYHSEIVKNSVCFDLYSETKMSNCYIDTFATGVKLNYNVNVFMINCFFYTNETIYKESTPPTLFYFNDVYTTRFLFCTGCSFYPLTNDISGSNTIFSNIAPNVNRANIINCSYNNIDNMPNLVLESALDNVPSESEISVNFIRRIEKNCTLSLQITFNTTKGGGIHVLGKLPSGYESNCLHYSNLIPCLISSTSGGNDYSLGVFEINEGTQELSLIAPSGANIKRVFLYYNYLTY